MTQTVQDFPVGTLVRKSATSATVYRVYRQSESQVALCKATTVKDPARGGWYGPRKLIKVAQS